MTVLRFRRLSLALCAGGVVFALSVRAADVEVVGPETAAKGAASTGETIVLSPVPAAPSAPPPAADMPAAASSAAPVAGAEASPPKDDLPAPAPSAEVKAEDGVAPAAVDDAKATEAAALDKAHAADAPKGKAKSKPKTKKSGAEKSSSKTTAAEPATVRPLPKGYLVVKKDRNAEDPEAKLTAARTALLAGNNSTALELFSEMYVNGSRDRRVLMGRAVALQRLGQTQQAVDAYKEVLNGDPKNLEALTNMLGTLKDQDPSSALNGLLQLREVYPANADIAAQLGTAYAATGENEKALKYLDIANALRPGNPDVLYNRAIVHDNMGKTEKAMELYRQILALAADQKLDQNFPIDAVRRRMSDMR